MPTRKVPHIELTSYERQRCAVLTGDIVSSSKLTPVQRGRVPGIIHRASKELRSFLRGTMPLGVDVFRGDSWQMLLVTPSRALRAALFFRAWLRSSSPSVDTRIAIGIGAVGYQSMIRVSEGHGEAFDLSGRTLEGMVKLPRMRFNCADVSRQRVWDATVGLIDNIIIQQWTPPRAQALTGALRSWRQGQITTLWGGRGIAQSSVSEFLSKAGWGAVKTALDAFEMEWRDAK